jgi:SAM-dependent MidA family methyltransferase
VYPENAWVTPVELFKPYYGYTIANFMLNQLESAKTRKLRVLEMGPGTGTFADSMLDFFKNYDLDIYRECEYTFVEISPQLAALCEELMKQNHPKLMETGKIKIFNGSIFDYTKRQGGGQSTFVVGLEVLDNMPHDRLYFDHKTGKLDKEVVI